MEKIIKLAVLAAVLFIAYDRGLPWIQENMGKADESAGNDALAGTRCVAAGDRANDVFGESIGRISGPDSDPDDWSDFVGRVESAINNAEARCRCGASSCDLTAQGMSALRDILGDFDDQKRGGEVMRGNPISQVEKVNDFLNQARLRARDGD